MGQENDASEFMGRSVTAIAEQVVAGEDRDHEAVRKALAEISEEGTVTRRGIDESLADLSKVVATPETRVEVAQTALADAREAAEPVRGTDVVRSRLNEFESEISALEERVDALGSRLSSLVERTQSPDDLYAIGRAIREIRSGATDAQRDADAIAVEIESFERKLRNPDRWADELREDIDAIEDVIEETLEVTTTVSDVEDDGDEKTDLALAWADTALQNRMQKLLIEDVQAELDVLQQIASHRKIDDHCDGIEQRLEELETLRTDISHRVDEVAEPSWGRKHSGVIDSFIQTLEEFEPPVNWAELQNELERHRERL